MNPSQDLRIQELLVDRATDCLNQDERDELKTLQQRENVQEDYSYDELVVAMQESFLKKKMNHLPDHIRSSVINRANAMMVSDASDLGTVETVISANSREAERASFPRREVLAWLAAAASLALGAFIWMQPKNEGMGGGTAKLLKSTSLISLSDETALNDFINNSPKDSTLVLDLVSGGDSNATNSKATVYWSSRLQRGFMKIDKLAKNDPTVEQYQLWVIDKQRGGVEGERPNAGVFDIIKDGLNIFEFTAGVEVFDAKAFAVTVEKPGGVVRSKLGRIGLISGG